MYRGGQRVQHDDFMSSRQEPVASVRSDGGTQRNLAPLLSELSASSCGFIACDGHLDVHNSLMSVFLVDEPPTRALSSLP